jgi:urease
MVIDNNPGTKLITVHNPISTTDGDLTAALYGSFLPVPSLDIFPLTSNDDIIEPGILQLTKAR